MIDSYNRRNRITDVTESFDACRLRRFGSIVAKGEAFNESGIDALAGDAKL